MPELIIAGRNTGMAAITTIVACSQTVQVRKFDHSRTGNHWSEAASGSEDGLIVVQDISNSGRHNCYAQRLSGERVTVEMPAGRCIWCICEEEMWNRLGTDVVRVERE